MRSLFLLSLALLHCTIAAAAGKCAFPIKQSCINRIPSEWQLHDAPASMAIEEACVSFTDYDANNCVVSGSIKVKADLPGFVGGIVAKQVTHKSDDLDVWVKAVGVEKGDASTIRTITYIQATSYENTFFCNKCQTDEWHPDVKCAISLVNPDDPKCLSIGAADSAGFMSMSASCNMTQNKTNTLFSNIGGLVLGALTGPVGLVHFASRINMGSPDLPHRHELVDLPDSGAIEYAYKATCPDSVESLNNGAEILVRRSKLQKYYVAKAMADEWNQQGSLTAHMLGEVPKTITIARGDSYWRLAETYYSAGWYWVGIAQSNKWKPLTPGSVVSLPPMQDLLFGTCYVREKESFWTVGARLKQSPHSMRVDSTEWLVRPRERNSIYPLERLRGNATSPCSN
jgi:nucleoid-associated protein YgaU